MADEKKENSYGFWAIVAANLIGTAAGYLIASYAANRKWGSEGYVDRAIRFLEDVKSKSQRGYGPERAKDI